MVEKSKDIETLIALFLNGEATPEQAILVMDWRARNEKNKRFYSELERIHALSNSSKVFEITPTDELWRNISQTTEKKKYKGRYVKLNKAVLAIAAVFVFALITTTVWFNTREVQPITSGIKKHPVKDPAENRILTAAFGLESFKLADQSEIKLESGSQLILAKDFNTNERRLRLKGSGAFNVIHDEKSPFILSVKKLEIYDIGTVFKVKEIGDTIKVRVDEGEVELRLNGQIIAMVEGDSAFYLVEQDIIKRYPTPKTRKDKVFVFDGTSLKDVASILSKFFEKQIVIQDVEIEKCPLTVRFKNENLITILDIIKELMDVKIVQNKNSIEIYGKGCN